MTKFKERLEELQPYVLGIRFNKGLTVVDTMFKDGWAVPNSQHVGFETIKEKPNYYMMYPLIDNVGVDEILEYVDSVVNLNIEREMKYGLLVEKIKELENIFKLSSLSKCELLKFTFDGDSDSASESMSITDMPLNVEVPEAPSGPVSLKTTQKPKKKEPLPTIEIKDGEPPTVETVEREVDSEVEAWNRQAQKASPTTAKVGNETFDLPPKDKIELETFDMPTVVCNCDPLDPDQVCPECMDSKF